MSRRAAILQSAYIPWKGYFDVIGGVDEFILYDDVQFTKNDWRNRNRIKTAQGLQWLTVPVRTTGRFGQPIMDVEVSDPRWGVKHWKSLEQAYGKAPHFASYRDRFEPLYHDGELNLSRINHRFLTEILEILGLETRISWSTDYDLIEGRTERLVHLCGAVGADVYLSGPAARSYLDEAAFEAAGIAVEWMDYSGYPEYPQRHPPFEHAVSVLDLLFNTGPDARSFMKSPR